MSRQSPEEDETLIAVSIVRMEASDDLSRVYGYGTQAVFRGECTNPMFRFRKTSRGLNREGAARFERLARHGFTVLPFPDNIRYGAANTHPHGWEWFLIEQATARIEALQQEREYMTGYDSRLADSILNALNDAFPRPLTNMELKRRLSPEPSDEEVLTALQALEIRRLINGKGMYEHQTAERRLVVMANITLTKEGHDELRGLGGAANPVTNYNNYGQTGAMGPHSSGVVNMQSEWNSLHQQVNLAKLSSALQNAMADRLAKASTPDDFQELKVLAEAKGHAEKQEGSKLLDSLLMLGKSALAILGSAGAKALVTWVEHKTGTHLS